MGPREMKRLVFILLTLALGLAFVALSAEVVVRLVLDDGMQYDLEMWKYAKLGKRVSDDPATGHEHRPGAVFRAMGVDVTINAYGMRGPEIERSKPEGTTRILMLGDSLTFGWGVPQDETVSARLQSVLRQEGHPVEVLNAGVGNTNTAMQVAYFLHKGHAFQPDIVVLNYFVNDAEPEPRYAPLNFLDEHSYAWIYLGSRFDVALRMLQSRQNWHEYYLGLYDEGRGKGWLLVRDAIDRLARYCREAAIPLLIVNYPELRQLRPYPFEPVNRLIESVAENDAIEYLDLLPSVHDEAPSQLWVTAPDPHPNSRANALFARAIQRRLQAMLDER